MKGRLTTAIGAIWVLCLPAIASEIPQHRGWVNDYAGVMNGDQRAELTSLIGAFERETTTEIAVVTISTTGNLNPKAYAGKLFNTWGVGKSDKNNGLVVLLAMKERRLEVEVGIGLEAALPDATVTRILERHAVPRLKQGRQGAALLAVVEQYIRLIREDIASPALRPESDPAPGDPGSHLTGATTGDAGTPTTLPANGMLSLEAEESQSPPAAERAKPKRVQPARPSKPPGLLRRWLEEARRNSQILLIGFEILAFGFLLSYLFREKFPDLTFFIVAAIGLGVPLLLNYLGILWGDEPLIAAGGSGITSFGMTIKLFSHRCPRCQKWMDIHTRTLVHPTYTSTGRGEKTEDCRHCGYHNVSIYTISRKTRSKSSSSSSSFSSSSSSFGGGSSRGGGGGVSW